MKCGVTLDGFGRLVLPKVRGGKVRRSDAVRVL